jgi:hypothetical protein
MTMTNIIVMIFRVEKTSWYSAYTAFTAPAKEKKTSQAREKGIVLPT